MHIPSNKCWITLWIYAFSLCLSSTSVQSSENKVALVIGNSRYQDLPVLKNANNDAVSMARALSKKGFTVFLSQDADTGNLRKAVEFVSKQAASADQILIYYAGHSVVQNGAAELLGVESDRKNQIESSPSPMTTTEVLKYFDYPFAQKAIILDACLELASGEGDQSLNLPQALGLETLLIFATSLGHAAYDGPELHSVFTGSFLDHIVKSNLDLQSTIQAVRKQVIQTSRTQQIPVSISTLTHPYYLLPGKLNTSYPAVKSDLIQSYSSSGYANKPLLDQISIGINPNGF